MWIHEGWTTYLNAYTSNTRGNADGLKYTNAYKSKVRNQSRLAQRGVNRSRRRINTSRARSS